MTEIWYARLPNICGLGVAPVRLARQRRTIRSAVTNAASNEAGICHSDGRAIAAMNAHNPPKNVPIVAGTGFGCDAIFMTEGIPLGAARGKPGVSH